MQSRSLVAFNTALASDNKIHDDVTARKFGFTGGLVPGVEVYAYLTGGPAREWGEQWLTSGSMSARFSKPAYDGETVTVEFDETTGEARLINPAGEVVSTGQAAMPEDPAPAPQLADYPTAALPDERPAASAQSLAAGQILGSVEVQFPDDKALTYLRDVSEDLPIFQGEQIAHPGWILGLANTILASNVVLGPWIHVGSTVQNHGLIRNGATVSIRGTTKAEYEKSGHRFTELDLAVFADDEPVAHISHTSIYLPRQVAEASA
ncbi:MAG: hypothetical protein ABI137_15985 [Antricoccus sp.]